MIVSLVVCILHVMTLGTEVLKTIKHEKRCKTTVGAAAGVMF